MSSDQYSRSIELGEVTPDVKLDGNVESGKTAVANSPEMNPIFKGLGPGNTFHCRMPWEKILIILIFIITLVLLLLLVILLHSTIGSRKATDQRNMESDNPCLTFSCLQAAVEIRKSLNTSVDPCTDFSQFVCGKWQSEQILPKGSQKYSTFDVVNADLFKIQKKLLENPEFKQENDIYSKAIKLYDSCINIEKINSLGAKPLLDYLNKTFGKYGGWEMLSMAEDVPLDLWNLSKVIEDPFVEPPIFRIIVQEDEKNSTRNIFNLQLTWLLLDKQFLHNETKPENKKIIDVYLDYMVQIGKLLNINPNKFTQFEEIVKLEIQIAKKHPRDEDQRDPESTYNKMKLSEIQRKYCQQFNWTEIFRTRLNMVNISMPDDMEIIVSTPANLLDICELFKAYSTKKRILHNYMMWRTIYTRISYLSEDFQRAKEKFRRVYYGVIGIKERWEYCVSIIQGHMSLILGNMYIKNNFNKQSKPQVLEMINLLKEKFQQNLNINSWMDDQTKSHALEKIGTMRPLIGYTDSILNKTYLEETFKDVEVNNETFFDNIDLLVNRAINRNYEKLNKRPENSTIETPQEVNAFYSPNKNEIIFPAGILQNPFFDPGFPRSLKYGGIGTAMGHEIIHGFDDTGSKYDSRGDLRVWWTEITRKLFKAKSDCFVQQYSKYSVYGHSINGENTLGENIADNGGVRLTYQVYKDLEKKYGKEKGLPGLKYTHDQLFFITFARLWCNLQTKQSMVLEIFSNVHTPNKFRVIGTLSNVKEFADAFNCPAGSPMNPVDRCMVW